MQFDIGIDDGGVASSHLRPNLEGSISRLERGKAIDGIIQDKGEVVGGRRVEPKKLFPNLTDADFFTLQRHEQNKPSPILIYGLWYKTVQVTVRTPLQ